MPVIKNSLIVLIGIISINLSLKPVQSSETLAATPSICPSHLGQAIDAIIDRPEFARSRWGIFIVPLSSSQVLYSRDAQKFFVPASNVKLLVSAAALQQFGSNYRIRTSVYGDNVNLKIVGRGDPSLTDLQLKQLAQQLYDRGIRSVDRLIGDDSYFQETALNPTWDWEDIQAGYGAPVNSLILNQNAIAFSLIPQALGQPLQVKWDRSVEAIGWKIENNSVTVDANKPEFITVGRDFAQPILRVSGQLQVGAEPETAAVAVTNPADNFLQHFQRILAAEGIAVNQTLVQHKATAESTLPELAFVESPPLSELLVETNQWSNNLYAETLLRMLGFGGQNSLEIVVKNLMELGINSQTYQLADAAGLSRQNLVSPEALVQTLKVMTQLPEAEVYRNSLAVAGVSGTLRNRFRGTPVEGKLYGKTGSIGGVAALSGYLDMPEYEPLAFSIIINQSDLAGSDMREAIDEIVLTLSQLRRC